MNLSCPEEVGAEAINNKSAIRCVIANQISWSLYIVHIMSESVVATVVTYSEQSKNKIFGETLAAAAGTYIVHLSGKLYPHLPLHLMSPLILPKESTLLYLSLIHI